MSTRRLITFYLAALLSLAIASPALAQDDGAEDFRMAALEALIAAPPERAMPLAAKVLRGNNSDEMKARALFILSQISLSEAQDILVETAREDSGNIRMEAIRMIGIGGNSNSLSKLRDLYDDGDEDVREAVLQALMIAGDDEAVYEIAVSASSASSEDDFEKAIRMLGVMGAHDQLRRLRESAGVSEPLIKAYAIAGDAESLRILALDSSDPDLQIGAIAALGIVGGASVNATLVEIYRGNDAQDIREAALQGMLISGYDEGVLELYRSSTDPAEKRELLRMLVIMDSDEVWDVIDSALDGNP